MIETLWGVVIGGTIGIVGTVLTTMLAYRMDRRRRQRDYEIRLISTSVEVLDQWHALALAHLAGDSDRLREAQDRLRDLDLRWEARTDVIPGQSAAALLRLAKLILAGPAGSRNPEAMEQMDRLVQLQSDVHNSAYKRTRDLQ